MSDNKMFRILVVDDEINNINSLCDILMPTYDVLVAKNGQAALQKATKHLPDLILLDVIMPDMTGFEVISVLKKLDVTRKIPVIFITGLDSSEDEEKGLLLGAVDYIIKPFHNSIVKARVATHLQIVEYINTIEHLCRVDSLTNIPNRRYFNSQMMIEWNRAVRDRRSLSVLLIDIDHFKKYNDTYGHQQGDVLLKNIAAIFEHSLSRATDFVSRWGGEEFAVILQDTDLSGAMEVAERIRRNVEKAQIPTAEGELTGVTVSIGVASEIPDKNANMDEFILRSDKALYIAKNTGRNCARAAMSE